MKGYRSEEFLGLIGKPSMPKLVLFDGSEDWIKQDAVEKIISWALPAESRDLNLDRFDAANDDIGPMVGSLQSVPFLGEKRVVVIQNAQKISTKEGKVFVEAIGNLPETTIALFLYDGKVKLREEIPAFISQKGAVVTCWAPWASQMPAWVTGEVKRRGKDISYDAARILGEACGDLEEISNELTKLFLYVGKKKRIESDDVLAHGLPDGSGDLFQLEEALWSRNLTESLTQSERLSEMGVRAEAAFPVFERIFRSLALARFVLDSKKGGEMDVFSALGIQGKKMKQNQIKKGLRNYSREDIRQSVDNIVQAHYDLKTGRLGSREVLNLLALNVAGRKDLAFR